MIWANMNFLGPYRNKPEKVKDKNANTIFDNVKDPCTFQKRIVYLKCNVMISDRLMFTQTLYIASTCM